MNPTALQRDGVVTRCSVCWRPVPAGRAGHLSHHKDTAGSNCPMSGRWRPTEDDEEGEVA